MLLFIFRRTVEVKEVGSVEVPAVIADDSLMIYQELHARMYSNIGRDRSSKLQPQAFFDFRKTYINNLRWTLM